MASTEINRVQRCVALSCRTIVNVPIVPEMGPLQISIAQGKMGCISVAGRFKLTSSLLA